MIDIQLEVEGYIIDNKYELLDDAWDLQDGEEVDVGKPKLPIQRAMHYIRHKQQSCRWNIRRQPDSVEMVDREGHARDENLITQHPTGHTLDATKHPIQLMVNLHSVNGNLALLIMIYDTYSVE